MPIHVHTSGNMTKHAERRKTKAQTIPNMCTDVNVPTAIEKRAPRRCAQRSSCDVLWHRCTACTALLRLCFCAQRIVALSAARATHCCAQLRTCNAMSRPTPHVQRIVEAIAPNAARAAHCCVHYCMRSPELRSAPKVLKDFLNVWQKV